jgi:diacylglycerol kinase
MIQLDKLSKSFQYAAKGLWRVAREEQNFRLELLSALAVVLLMFVFDLRTTDRAILTLAIILVLVLELMNSIFERMVDLLKPRIHHYVEDIKDIMAGTVLVASVGSALIGILIFWPHIADLFQG